jgi:DNA-directed RNA polymerase specialized sigma24 family protein
MDELDDHMIKDAIENMQSYVRRCWNNDTEFESAGNEAIIEASKLWDPRRGPWITYSFVAVKNACGKLLKEETHRHAVEKRWRPQQQQETLEYSPLFSRIPDQDRGLSFLRWYHDFTYQEIADAINWPYSTVYVKLKQIAAHLQ